MLRPSFAAWASATIRTAPSPHDFLTFGQTIHLVEEAMIINYSRGILCPAWRLVVYVVDGRLFNPRLGATPLHRDAAISDGRNQ